LGIDFVVSSVGTASTVGSTVAVADGIDDEAVYVVDTGVEAWYTVSAVSVLFVAMDSRSWYR
jgi:hypothetical protein